MGEGQGDEELRRDWQPCILPLARPVVLLCKITQTNSTFSRARPTNVDLNMTYSTSVPATTASGQGSSPVSLAFRGSWTCSVRIFLSELLSIIDKSSF